MDETKGVCGRCKDGKGTKKVLFKCETCTSFTCALCEGGDTAGVRIKAKKLGRFDCLLCKGVKGEDITLITLAKKLEALEKNMTTKAEMEDILKQLAVVKQENVDLRQEPSSEEGATRITRTSPSPMAPWLQKMSPICRKAT
jgi:hypothetical protein